MFWCLLVSLLIHFGNEILAESCRVHLKHAESLRWKCYWMINRQWLWENDVHVAMQHCAAICVTCHFTLLYQLQMYKIKPIFLKFVVLLCSLLPLISSGNQWRNLSWWRASPSKKERRESSKMVVRLWLPAYPPSV